MSMEYRFDMNQIQNRSAGRAMPNGTVLFFGAGKYDNYCMYLGKPVWNPTSQSYDVRCGVVTDAFYYEILGRLAERYGASLIYDDILVRLYNMTMSVAYDAVLTKLEGFIRRVIPCEDDQNDCILACSMVYYGMVAEENHQTVTGQAPVCGKVLKLYALHLYLKQGQPLIEGVSGGVCRMLQGQNPLDVLKRAAGVGIFRQVAVLYL